MAILGQKGGDTGLPNIMFAATTTWTPSCNFEAIALEQVDRAHIQIEMWTTRHQVEAQVVVQLVGTLFWDQLLTPLPSVQGATGQVSAHHLQQVQVTQVVIPRLL